MAADYQHARLLRLVRAADQDRSEDVLGQRDREPDDVQRDQRPSAHRVHVAERVRHGDLPERIRVVHYRREEVHRLDERGLVVETIHRGVVPGVHSDEQVLVRNRRKLTQDLTQVLRAELRGSTGAASEAGQPNGIAGIDHVTSS